MAEIEKGWKLWSMGAYVVGSALFTFFVLKKFVDSKMGDFPFSAKKPTAYLGQIKKLVIYPIKSCKGVEVTSATCTAEGLVHESLRDRLV